MGAGHRLRLIAPTLFGVFIELAALAFGFFGFRPGRAAAAPAPVTAQAQTTTSPPPTQEAVTALAKRSTVESDPAPVNQANDAPAPEASARR